MINFIYESVADACHQMLGIKVEFKRVEEKSQPMAPAFLIVANDIPTSILFNSALINDPKFTLAQLVPQIIQGLIMKIVEDVQKRQ